jgi:hypothetical protein
VLVLSIVLAQCSPNSGGYRGSDQALPVETSLLDGDAGGHHDLWAPGSSLARADPCWRSQGPGGSKLNFHKELVVAIARQCS